MARIYTSLRGDLLGLSAQNRLVCPAGFVSGQHGSQIYLPSPTMVSLIDHFTGDSVDAQWDAKTGSDGSVVTPTVNSQSGGVVRLTTGAGAGATMAVNGVQLQRFLCWKAANGNLAIEAKIKMSAITNICVFMGFTDQVSGLEMPINSASSADTFTTTATDAVGFMFDTAMTTAKWWITGVAADTDATMQNTGIAPVAATFQTLRVEVDTLGNATFFINGAQVGTTANSTLALAVTPTVLLTPYLGAFTRSAASATVDCDYLHASMLS